MARTENTQAMINAFSLALRNVLARRNMTVRDLCVAMGYEKAVSHIVNIVMGKAKARPDTVTLIEAALDLKTGTLGQYYIERKSEPVRAAALDIPVEQAMQDLEATSMVKHEDIDDLLPSDKLSRAINGFMAKLIPPPEPRGDGISIETRPGDTEHCRVTFRGPLYLSRKKTNRLLKLLVEFGVVPKGTKVPKKVT